MTSYINENFQCSGLGIWILQPHHLYASFRRLLRFALHVLVNKIENDLKGPACIQSKIQAMSCAGVANRLISLCFVLKQTSAGVNHIVTSVDSPSQLGISGSCCLSMGKYLFWSRQGYVLWSAEHEVVLSSNHHCCTFELGKTTKWEIFRCQGFGDGEGFFGRLGKFSYGDSVAWLLEEPAFWKC